VHKKNKAENDDTERAACRGNVWGEIVSTNNSQRRRKIVRVKKPDDDSNLIPAGLSQRMLRPRPDPTELQMFGAPGIVVVGFAVIGILYALVQFLR